MIKLLKQPYPGSLLQFEIANTISVIAAFCVFFVLAFLRPFGLSAYSIGFIYMDAGIFGTVTFFVLKLNFIFFKFLTIKGLLNEEKWTIGKEIIVEIWLLLIIGFFNSITAHIVYSFPLSSKLFSEGLSETVIVGIFPCLAILAIRQYTLLKKYSTQAEEIDQKLSPPPLLIKDNIDRIASPVSFQDEVSHTDIKVNPNVILFIVAADNYIKIYYLENNVIQNLLVRGTLKNVEEKLTNQTNFYRCHRSYLVNLTFVRHISGNAQGYKLHLEGTEELIPVSRSLNNEIGEKVLLAVSGSN